MSEPFITYHPAWLLRLVAEVERYEYVHPHVRDIGEDACLARALDLVPRDVRMQAQGFIQGQRVEQPAQVEGAPHG